MSKEPDPDIIEAIAATNYAHSFSARLSREGWETVKQRAEDGGSYANVIVERCYQQAFDIWEIVG